MIKIDVKNDKVQYECLLNMAFAYGYKFDMIHGNTSVGLYTNMYQQLYPNICLDDYGIVYGSMGDGEYTWPEDATEIIEYIKKGCKPPVTVKLNDKYDAIVSKDTVVVGCQTFPIDIIDKLVKARNSFN